LFGKGPTFFVCSLSVAGAIFLIPELDRSFEGLLQISSAPLGAALAQARPVEQWGLSRNLHF
jgi:hypothetical protein